MIKAVYFDIFMDVDEYGIYIMLPSEWFRIMCEEFNV